MADVLSRCVDHAKQFTVQRTVVFTVTALLSFLVFVPLAVLTDKFNGKCLLYSGVEYVQHYNASGKSLAGPDMILFRIRFGPQSVCEYNLTISILFSLLYSLAMVGFYIYILVKKKNIKETKPGWVVMVVQVVVEVVVVVLMLVAACTLSHGMATLCGDLTDTRMAVYQVDRCADAQSYNWRGYDGSNFHVCLTVAVVGSWLQVILWTVQAALMVWQARKLDLLPSPPLPKICRT